MGWIFGAFLLALADVCAFAIASGTNMNARMALPVFVALSIVLYFWPSIAAGRRKHPSALAIFAVNLFLGWTLLGWVFCFGWGLSRREPVTVEVHAPAPSPVTAPLPVTPAPAARPASVADEIGKLAALRDAGILTTDEFEIQKRRALGA